MTRLPVKKTYKLFIGGSFPRSESGRTYEAEGQNVARASRKDARDVRALDRVRPARLGARERAADEELVGLLDRQPAHASSKATYASSP